MPDRQRASQYDGERRRMESVSDSGHAGFLAHWNPVGHLRILAENKIGIFAISTFNTDYILTKEENYQKALDVLSRAGYKIVE